MLEFIDVSFSVEEEGIKKEILKDINLEIKENFVAITGPNGSGKSTLAKLIVGIEKPTEGKIIFEGTDITNLPINERADLGISFAFQQPVKFKGLKVKDMLDLSVGEHLSIEDACSYLSEVGLCAKSYLDRELNSSLSGGELKRIEIAMIMARGTKLSVLDEPEAGIDLWSFQNLIQVFEAMDRKTKGTKIVISHQERILEIADKIIVLEKGKIKQIGKKEEILSEILNVSDDCKLLKGVDVHG